MASKGERTRAEVISRTAALLNREGFLAAPMSAIVQATGLQKGGLYRHFESRELLRLVGDFFNFQTNTDETFEDFIG